MHIFKYLHWHPSLGLIYKRPEDLRTTSMFTMSSDASFNDVCDQGYCLGDCLPGLALQTRIGINVLPLP